ncbi:lysophospholipid acyltransferase family protein [Motiliproteus sp. MSK22-1]|uniref:lysophospholipid acyltransferase family protein n=1 Tax=Motiliproteus sp. MSK22-1 TaxID=1897630 RepID=UPI0009765F98|nr:lysophospholipid acyltransferase family protein [Motiliproteus sp. MSK22-1]OMH38372.1 hypothetical protein BGP75_07455 [Motiliproteus sp. MSK22-1]
MARITCRLLLKLFGWQVDKQVPAAPKYILIGYPHTSNWDFILAMLAKGALNLRFHWVAKDSLFWWPLGPLMRAMGGIPVNRRISTGFIDQLALRYQQQDQLAIVITPEGTRSYRDYWKSGFYHLALAAKVPVALGYIDFPTKRLGIGPLIELSGDLDRDLTTIREFYADKVGLNPKDAGAIQFRKKRNAG